MTSIKKTDDFGDWLKKLKDHIAKARIIERIRLAEGGDFGDCKMNIDDGISEMRIHVGPGYRLYFCQIGETDYLLLIGETKKNKKLQNLDIERAKKTRRKELGQ
jgi:putative addiction module killer protein